MFSNTAYEALYQILGLELHSKFIELITGEAFFKGLILLIFGVMFFFTVLKFASRYIPGSLVERRHLPLSKFIKVIACLFLGLAILRVGSNAKVTDYKGKNWAENPYVQGRFQGVEGQYRVSLVFELISHTAEELTALLSRVIDGVFAKGNSQLTAPNLFYKAIMFAGITTIDDPKLRDQLQFYSDECFTKVIPSIDQFQQKAVVEGFFAAGQSVDRELQDVQLELGDGKKTNCLNVKESTVSLLNQYALEKTNGVSDQIPPQFYTYGGGLDPSYFKNYTASMALVNYYADQREGRMGIQKGATAPGTAGSIFQTMNRVFSWDGLLGMFGFRETQGASEAARRSQEFSEHLARAPHVAGFIRMILIAVFPWLIFFVVAGRWRVLVVWFWIYFSVLLWTPLWTLLYHIMLGIAMSSEVMQAFGQMSDGVSLYSAALVSHRLYYMFSIYAWVQLMVATLTTGSVFMFLKPMLGQGTQEDSPDFLGTAQGVGGAGVDLSKARSITGVAEVLL
jgi:hypothetical protein